MNAARLDRRWLRRAPRQRARAGVGALLLVVTGSGVALTSCSKTPDPACFASALRLNPSVAQRDQRVALTAAVERCPSGTAYSVVLVDASQRQLELGSGRTGPKALRHEFTVPRSTATGAGRISLSFQVRCGDGEGSCAGFPVGITVQ
ncbi:hypothetical protein G9U51_11085 [Calidifontibacter sp. DB0510]|uniref:Uncharacterized protein n=1 Tax=Metallococcus carri TaxID=1656884 RepID=A0A967B2Y8_9MICO|nr:hypothetical protein [Metallococcus carri]NHN56320.1 hypothetical protein [Metallococcus carri]NOP38628.1 hypothetical protein [Calidifontibacter sp. DB2511S]